MTTSFKDIQQAERYLLGQMSTEDRLVFEAQLLINPTLRMNVFFQKKVYHIIKLFTRREVKLHMEIIHDRIFNDPSKADVQQTILKFFNP